MEKKKNKNEIDFTLNKEGKDIFRERISKKLADIEFNPDKRIKLSKDKLETLLFDYDEVKKCKKIGYTYEGLCKLDLSEISLENVDLECKFPVDLSNTNISINFNEIYKGDDVGKFYIKNINFANTDLSSTVYCDDRFIRMVYSFINCDLSNTHFNFSDDDMEFKNCDFSNNDFNGLDLCCNGGSGALLWDENKFFNCNFSGTKVSVHIGNFYKDDTYSPDAATEQIGKLVKDHYLDGCVVNGNLMKSIEQRKEEAKELKEKYKGFFSHYINDTLDMIDEQLPSYGGKNQASGNDKNNITPSKPKDSKVNQHMPKKLKYLPINSEEI